MLWASGPVEWETVSAGPVSLPVVVPEEAGGEAAGARHRT